MENEHLPDKQTKKRAHHKKSQHKKTTTKKHSRKNMNSFVFHLTQICVLCIVLGAIGLFFVAGYPQKVFSLYLEAQTVASINIDKLNEFNKYKKPWYELTQYNFTYFRNTMKEPPNTVSDKLRRVYANYYVIRLIFNNFDNKRIEFESLECAQTQFRKL